MCPTSRLPYSFSCVVCAQVSPTKQRRTLPRGDTTEIKCAFAEAHLQRRRLGNLEAVKELTKGAQHLRLPTDPALCCRYAQSSSIFPNTLTSLEEGSASAPSHAEGAEPWSWGGWGQPPSSPVYHAPRDPSPEAIMAELDGFTDAAHPAPNIQDW
ncbi:hypothetical protein K523DRAFT_422473, partial [Schizophyllum commune Tattone D]